MLRFLEVSFVPEKKFIKQLSLELAETSSDYIFKLLRRSLLIPLLTFALSKCY